MSRSKSRDKPTATPTQNGNSRAINWTQQLHSRLLDLEVHMGEYECNVDHVAYNGLARTWRLHGRRRVERRSPPHTDSPFERSANGLRNRVERT
jgi:hypothetical protein